MDVLSLDSDYAIAVALLFAAILAGLIFRDYKRIVEASIGIGALAILLAIGVYVKNVRSADNEQPTAPAVNDVADDTQPRIPDKAPSTESAPANPRAEYASEGTKEIAPPVEQVNNPAPKIEPKGPLADGADKPPPTFDPESPVPIPKPPWDTVPNPQRQRGVVLRQVPTPKGYVPPGTSQTLNGPVPLVPGSLPGSLRPSQTGRWVQQRDGTWKYVVPPIYKELPARQLPHERD